MLKNNVLRHLIIGFLAIASFSVQAQKRHPSGLNLRGADAEPWSFGILFNLSNYGTSYTIENPPIDKQELNIHSEPGAGIRFVAERRLAHRLDLRVEPGILLDRAGIGNPDGGITEVQLPLLLKFQGQRHANFNPFLIAGYLGSLKTSQELENWAVPYKRVMHSVEAGAGIDFYLKKSKLGLGVRMNTPLASDQRKDKPSALSNLKSKALVFFISFETKDGWKLYAR